MVRTLNSHTSSLLQKKSVPIVREIPMDQLDIVRCPLCHGPMVARYHCKGPYFHCLCAEIDHSELHTLPLFDQNARADSDVHNHGFVRKHG